MSNVYRRIGVFQALEVYALEAGQWWRVPAKSTKSITDLVNDWSAEQQVEVLSVSTPAIEVINRTDSEIVYRTAVSIIYTPSELIQHAEEKTEHRREITIPTTAQEIHTLLHRLQHQ